MKRTVYSILFINVFFLYSLIHNAVGESTIFRSPVALAASNESGILYAAESGVNQIALIKLDDYSLCASIPLPAEPTGLALSPNGEFLYITCAASGGSVCILDTKKQRIVEAIPAGYGACSPVVSPDGQWLYVCNQFNNDVSIIDLQEKKEISRFPVIREPVSAVLTRDGQRLFVANHLPFGPSNADFIAAKVSVIDAAERKTIAEIALPNGSTSLRSLCLSPDGRYIFLTHILARFQMPTTQLDRGWMNTNALTIIDVEKTSILNTVLLDDIDLGAANPWGAACSADGAFLCIAHAGTHELSVIDAPALLQKLQAMPSRREDAPKTEYPAASKTAADVPNDLSFIAPFRRRIAIEALGPRELIAVGSKAITANYFSGDLSMIDIRPDGKKPTQNISLGPQPPITPARQGEINFHDASLCFQHWQSCSSCHPGGRSDGLNWDLLNDGVGNPKNTKSMLLTFETPPVMSEGVRTDAKAAVRSGIRHIQFSERPEADAAAIDEYLQAMKPLPSPYLVNGNLNEPAQRGEKIFFREDVGCAVCHNGPYFTNLQAYAVGTKGEFDKRSAFDTPALIELWRTAPYLHDGAAANLRDVFTAYNRNDQHGRTSRLTEREFSDLIEYLLSL
ncbi:MAG: cell surface protein [Candidatus Omnitrophota bacterium]